MDADYTAAQDRPANRDGANLARGPGDYVIRVLDHPGLIPPAQWNQLLAAQGEASPFLQHAYLLALHESGCANAATGWQPSFVTLWRDEVLQGACPLYFKQHSYGEYVFDWSWAQAHERHGLPYYPKALVAVPFTPVPGARLLARDTSARQALLTALIAHCKASAVSSLHLLFVQEQDRQMCEGAGLLGRRTVQFHWHNHHFHDFAHFLTSLTQDKRKKIRQERRKVTDAGVYLRTLQGTQIGPADWDFFWKCYEQTYLEHGNAPYLSRDFFARLARDMPHQWLMFIALREGRPIASSLIGLNLPQRVAYGRYWGALEKVDCLHFEACYYQPIEWCIANGMLRFEGGAQGEHKMARALMPVSVSSAHWLRHPAFGRAVQEFLELETAQVHAYMDNLAERSPLKSTAP